MDLLRGGSTYGILAELDRLRCIAILMDLLCGGSTYGILAELDRLRRNAILYGVVARRVNLRHLSGT